MPSPFRRLLAVFALGFVCALSSSALLAQPAPESPKKELTEAVSSGFAKLRPLLDAKNYPAALTLVRQLLAAAPAKSYDVYVLSQIQAQILLTQNKLVEAIAPLERADALAEGNANFLEMPARLERLNLLAQLHYQAGAEQKTPARQRAGYEKSLAYLRRCAELGATPSADASLFTASLRYNLATLDPAKTDTDRLREAAADAREALVLSAKPNRQARLLLAACHQQLGETALAADQLEVLAAENPADGSVWPQLQAFYLGAAAEARDPAEARAQNLRALITLERAQAVGQLTSPKDHYAKVAILYNLRQFARAAALLEKDLADGTLEGSKRNWELLASAYQQADQEARALDAYARAVERFPAQADLEFSFAQTLYAAGKTSDAYARGRSAVAKPGLEKPGQARLYLAFLAYELQRYDEAAEWIAEARSDGGVPAASLEPLARAIADALALREALKKS